MTDMQQGQAAPDQSGPPPRQDIIERIEGRIDVKAAGSVGVSFGRGGIIFTSMAEVMEMSKLMAVSKQAVPPHCRGEVGICFGIVMQAIEWNMSPFAVANKSYLVNDRIAYESQLIHAVIEARAPLKERLAYEITGEGEDRRCRVWGTFKGESSPRYFTSEPLKTFTKTTTKQGRNGPYTVGPKSPLWADQPEVQLFYHTSRNWCRIYCPGELMGIYAPDELEDSEDPAPPAIQSPQLLERLPGRIGGAGFGSAESAMPITIDAGVDPQVPIEAGEAVVTKRRTRKTKGEEA